MIVTVICCFIGCLFYLVGKLIGNNPNLLAGYYKMDKAERDEFDKSGKHLLKRIFYGWGAYIVVGTLICSSFFGGAGNVVVLLSSCVIFIAVIISLGKSNFKSKVG